MIHALPAQPSAPPDRRTPAPLPDMSGAADFRALLAPPETAAFTAAANEAGARVFNENGFFGETADAPAAAAVAANRAEVRSATAAADMAPAHPTDQPPPLAPAAPQAASPGRQTPPAATPARLIRAGIVPHAEPADGTSLPATTPGDRLEPAHDAGAPDRPAATLRRLPPRAFAAVALRVIGQGAEVVARLAAVLDDADRARLADEIGTLLAEHGYAPAAITLLAAREHR